MKKPTALTVRAGSYLATLTGGFLVAALVPLPVSAEQQRNREMMPKMYASGPGVSNHPVGVVPSNAVSVPAGWPLAADGSVTCLTCHTAMPGWAAGSDPKLRGLATGQSSGLTFCTSCHTQGAGGNAGSAHWMAVGVAHVKPEDSMRRRSANLLDSGSRQCLSCHDGVGARDSASGTPSKAGHGFVGDMRRSHPVGMDYPSWSRSKSGGRFQAASSLPSEVRLVEGKVSCVSCHDLYGDDRNLLAVPMEGSKLCLTCHDMK